MTSGKAHVDGSRNNRSSNSSSSQVTTARRGKTSKLCVPLQVLVLDEIEYARVTAKSVLTSLSLLSFARPMELALIFVSNQRDLIHVPGMLLQELPFTAYSVDQLKYIASFYFTQQL
uniref:Uncharacterized protein n=1 Tax=Lygus hesperus TaxID=30085 RepID=A0A146M9Q9_LYGHE